MTALAELHGVTRRYGDVVALDGVDLSIDAAQILGLLGPNGAGKTTLLSLVAGLIRPTHGEVRLFGRDPRDADARRRLGTTPQQTALPDTLRVGEVIDFVELDVPPATLSFHLKELAHADLVESRQAGRFVIYTARFSTMNELIGYLTDNCCGGNPCGPVEANCTPPVRSTVEETHP